MSQKPDYKHTFAGLIADDGCPQEGRACLLCEPDVFQDRSVRSRYCGPDLSLRDCSDRWVDRL